ncbi:MAG: hypothetical protein MUC33_13300 [Desulfobacterales bacterium]|jgi:hypothetical protein|nr:hypothetical protein [Desulfobacterales bacterium]
MEKRRWALRGAGMPARASVARRSARGDRIISARRNAMVDRVVIYGKDR